MESDFGAAPLFPGILHAGLDATGLEDVADLGAEGDAACAAVFLCGFGNKSEGTDPKRIILPFHSLRGTRHQAHCVAVVVDRRGKM